MKNMPKRYKTGSKIIIIILIILIMCTIHDKKLMVSQTIVLRYPDDTITALEEMYVTIIRVIR